MINSIITINPDIQSGLPVFTGTRVPIKSFFDYISTGESIESYLEDFPYINRVQIDGLMNQIGFLFQEKRDLQFYENTFG